MEESPGVIGTVQGKVEDTVAVVSGFVATAIGAKSDNELNSPLMKPKSATHTVNSSEGTSSEDSNGTDDEPEEPDERE